ncbi:hypothetical protein BMI90_17545 [Thioclava sp. L04-15]|uniref:hypothetical protein n=1 Tax=Thioclava sp. L04-15 TaxID=1915318 RepID=UPI000998D530|nr:hypothetical protein [Thioclava sp. L04-15]OOY26512.1 hypothetical protein BMI90_17545 [Thioclava sp. L04-15]TNE83392.1 MAG: hypothetical protein EP337_16315 [Paracoccaceae bacterium]
MVGANKILTVSYGTFSCTLEGFDEPFNTMKAIAEYFRDLAADDRYFGAEPPQPDAEMLHRIAEREIQRRVEAKIQENGVVLRAQDTLLGAQAEAAEAPAAPVEEPLVTEAPAPEPVAEEPAPQSVAAEVTPEPAPEVAPAAGEPASDSVAAKLQRIREAVARARAAQSESFAEEDEPAPVMEPEALLGQFDAQTPAESEDFGYELDISGPLSIDEIAADEAEELSGSVETPEAEAAIEAPAVSVEAEEDVIAEEIAQAETGETTVEAVAEDHEEVDEETAEAAEAADPEAEKRQALRRARRAAKRQKRIAALKAMVEELSEEEVSEDEAVPALEMAEEAPEVEEAQVIQEAPAIEEAAEAVSALSEAPFDEEAVVDDASSEEDLAAEEPEQLSEDAIEPEEISTTIDEIAIEPEEIAEAPGEEAAAETPPLRARVIKVRRREAVAVTEAAIAETAEAVVAEQDEEEDDLAARLAAELGAEEEAQDKAPVMGMPGSLSPEDEEDLMRELAALEEDDTAEAPAVEDAEIAADMPEIDLSGLSFEPIAEPVVQVPAEAEIEAEVEIVDEAAEEEAPVAEVAAEVEEVEEVEETLAGIGDVIEAEDIVEPEEALVADEASEAQEPVVAEEEHAEAEQEPEMLSEEPDEIPSRPDVLILGEALASEPEEDEVTFDHEEDAAELSEEIEAAAEKLAEEDAAQQEPAIAARETTPLPLAPVSEDDREAEMSRLLAEADKQAKGVETRRRFSAIAHLKAAVAATVADRLAKGQDTASGGAPESDASEPYRADLTQAVRPRRPVNSGETHSRRPEPMRPAPLVLVSEQRIDSEPVSEAPSEEEAPVGKTHVIRPRRISAAQIAAAEEAEVAPMDPQQATSFTEFAESLGTQGLSDLLEAAAAYTAAVEGRPHFSPPQIMRKLASFEETAEVPREERMRVFGRLLRQGKITKVKRGQYAITAASRYWDEAKIASNQ